MTEESTSYYTFVTIQFCGADAQIRSAISRQNHFLMAKTLPEYADWLDERQLIWPKVPVATPAKAKPFVKPLPGIRGVSWSVYGTLLSVVDGQFIFEPPLDEEIRLEIALEKTIHEFNMWNSMVRRPGKPSAYMMLQYRDVVSTMRMAGTGRKGDLTEVDSTLIWGKLVGRLLQKEYTFDESIYGDFGHLCEKVAYFFHSALQGVRGAANALTVLKMIPGSNRLQGLLADGQSFTLVQLLRGLRGQGKLLPLKQMFSPHLVTMSYREQVRKPSRSLYQLNVARFAQAGIEPHEILHIGSRLADDLAMAKQAGMKTALYAGDKRSLQATQQDMKDPAIRPDRLITDLIQLREILIAD